MRVLSALITMPVVLASIAFAAEKYSGPRPEKADVPYLLHASNLVETEVVQATEEKRKDGSAFIISGAQSPVKTPLAEPIFLIKTQKLSADRFELFPLDSKNGKREVFFNERKTKNNRRPVHVTVQKVDEGLYRIEANEELENGEYSLSPRDSNQAFCFSIY